MNDSYQMPIQIQSDENGFYDRECPNEDCLYTFKVDLHGWEEKIAGRDMHCPRCGQTAFHDQWFTQGQIEALRENVSSFALGLVHDELKRDMTVLVNRRHLLTHGNGIVDGKYIRNTGDNSYELGQRIIVKDKDLLRLLDIIEKIVDGLLSG